jgi:hypothetical protein
MVDGRLPTIPDFRLSASSLSAAADESEEALPFGVAQDPIGTGDVDEEGRRNEAILVVCAVLAGEDGSPSQELKKARNERHKAS